MFLVRSLAETLLYCKKNYYNGFKSVCDEAYDYLEMGLKKLCPGHPVLNAVGDAPFDGNLLGVAGTRALLYPPPVEDTTDFLGSVDGEDLL